MRNRPEEQRHQRQSPMELGRTRIRAWALFAIGLVVALTADPGVTWAQDPAPRPAEPAARYQEMSDFVGSTFYFGDEAIDLTIVPNRIAVFHPPGTSIAERRAVATRHAVLAAAEAVEEIPTPAVSVYSLAEPLDPGTLRRSMNAIAADPAARNAAPVYRSMGIELVPTGNILLQLDVSVSPGRLEEWLELHDLQLVAESPVQAGNFIVRPEPAGDAADDQGRAGRAVAIGAALRTEPGVVFSEPDLIRRLERMSAPDDPHFGNQWGLHNPGGPSYPRDVDIDAPEGWEIQEGCHDVTIAILDEGCDMTHPDYDANLTAGWDFPGNDSIPAPNAWDGHGTACAGVAAALTDNARGVAGVAGGAQIMPIRIAYSPAPGDPWITTTQWLADAITWAYANGADVLSNSWGGGPPSNQIRAAIANATLFGRGGQGSVVVFAAGNDNSSPPSYPGLHEESLCVGATSPCDERKNPGSCDGESWWGSNYGPGLDVSAPGVKIPTTDIQGGGGYDPGDYFLTFNGTSSATPHVAGIAALVICKFPHYSAGEVRGRIEQTCDKVGGYAYNALSGRCDELGHGRVNLYRALSGKPQVDDTFSAADPSVYQDDSDEWATYPYTYHLSAAYEWLGEEYSPERAGGGTPDPDGAPNAGGRDAFDDGVTYYPPYIPGRMGRIDYTVSVENPSSDRYQSHQLYVNIWMDWQADDDWNNAHDWVLQNRVIDPSTWGGVRTKTFTHTFLVPDVPIDFLIQTNSPGDFLHVRTRVTHDQPLTSADQIADFGEVEDDRFLNYVEMFNSGAANVSVVEMCPVWHYYDGSQLPWGCHPAFTPDAGTNGYMCAEWYHPQYVGDSHAAVLTPSFDLSELTEAFLQFEYCGLEFATGRVKLYNRGVFVMTLADIYHPLSNPPCAEVDTLFADLTPFCDEIFDDVVIALETHPGDPCGTPIPQQQDWKIDNLFVWGQDRIAPDPAVASVTPTSLETAIVDWTAPGDDGPIRTAELYNWRYGPEPITSANWRHSLWLRPEMAPPLPVPAPPGTAETITVQGLTGGLHYLSVRTLDEVNNIAPVTSGGQNRPPTVTSPDTVQTIEGIQVSFTVTATDPDFDPVQLFATGLPAGATFIDQGSGTGDFDWTPGSGDLGSHLVLFTGRDTNGASDTDTTVIVVDPAAGTGACCLPSNCCQMLTASDCAALGGTFQGTGTDCDPYPCGPALPHLADHDNAAAHLTVTDQGIVGFTDGTQAEGLGFIYPAGGGANQLYLGSLWVGADAAYVAGRDYDADPEPDWDVSLCPDGRVQESTQGPLQRITAAFGDRAAATPLGLEVAQESWSYGSPASDDDFVIVRYLIRNGSGANLTGLRAGLFLDFDMMGQPETDTGGTDANRRLAYLADSSGVHAGVRMLEPAGGGLAVSNVTLVSNPTYVWPNQYVLDADKFGLLAAASGYVLSDAPTMDDYSVLVSAGPFSLAPGDSAAVAFAIVGGMTENDLLIHADRAQALFSGGTASVEDGAGDEGAGDDGFGFRVTRLLPSRPNPFHARTQLRFELPHAGRVELAIYDVGGRRVRSVMAEEMAAGEHHALWTGRDDQGRPVSGGVYYARLRTAEATMSQPVILLR